MKIGLVVSDDLDYGLDLAPTLAEAGVSVTLYLSQTNLALYLGQPASASSPDQLVAALYQKGLLPQNIPVRLFRFPRMRDPRSLAAALHLRRRIEADNPDVVHLLVGPGELWMAVLSCLMRRRRPIVSTMIVPEPNLGDRLPVSILRMIARLLVLGSEVVIVNGREQVELVRKLYAARRVVHVPLVPRISAAKWADRDRDRDEEPGTVLFTGKAQPRKGLEYLVRAQPFVTRRVPDAKFLLAAHGDDLARCRAFIADETKFEIHDGFLTSAELAEYFQRASLVALPYLSASTSGLLTTAYVFGKPVVATRVGALPEYVPEEATGLLVPPADAESLAEAIVRLLTDDELRQRMGSNAREWVRLEQKKVAGQTIGVYETARTGFRTSQKIPAALTIRQE